MRIGMAFVLYLGMAATAANAAAEEFSVRPYLFSTSDRLIQVGWSYRAGKEPAGPVELRLFSDGRPASVVPARVDQGLYLGEIHRETCGQNEAAISYQVPGMPAPVVIENPPCWQDSETTKFSFLSDSQEGPEIVGAFQGELRRFRGNAILHGGDVVQDGSVQQEWVDYFAAMDPLGGSRVTFPAVGNHEYRLDGGTFLWSRFFQRKANEAFYSVHLGPVHVIVLNSCFEDDTTLPQKQLDWLKAELEKPSQWKVVVFHHPPYSSGIGQSSFAPKKEHLTLRRLYVPLFELYKVDLVLNGHTHLFERSFKAGVRYLTTGPAGGKMGFIGASNPYSEKLMQERTVMHFEVAHDMLREVTVGVSGQPLDEVILKK